MIKKMKDSHLKGLWHYLLKCFIDRCLANVELGLVSVIVRAGMTTKVTAILQMSSVDCSSRNCCTDDDWYTSLVVTFTKFIEASWSV